jgi:lipopolysaccharide export system protein LptA
MDRADFRDADRPSPVNTAARTVPIPEDISNTARAVTANAAATDGSMAENISHTARSVPANATATARPKVSAAGAGTKTEKFRVHDLLINSDTMTFDKETSEAVFSGSVTAKASDVAIYSTKLVSKNYRENAVATGNVRAIYRKFGVNITCGRLEYSGGLNDVKAYEDVVAHKALADGNTVTMYCQELYFNASENTMTAKKSSDKRVRVVMKDIVAFSDEVSYNDGTRQLYFTGRPIIKKSKSIFLSDNIWLGTDDKSIKMKDNIWTRLFYRDFEKTNAEVQVEADKNAASGKTLQ